MVERLASYGFVVVAPDHPGTTLMDLLDTYGQAAEKLVHRPKLLTDSVDAVRAGAVRGLQTRGDKLALVGHSMGSLTILPLGGGHNGPTDICNIPAASLVGADCAYERNGFAEPNGLRKLANRHTLAWLASRFGNQPNFAQHLGPGDGFVWQQK